MDIQWTEDLRTGDPLIDEQHQELFRRIGGLETACTQQRCAAEIKQYLAFLIEYVEYHFSAEEKRMDAAGYPGLESHRGEHARFRSEIGALANEISASGAGMTLIQTTLWTSAEWLYEHVKGTDRTMAAYLNGRPQ